MSSKRENCSRRKKLREYAVSFLMLSAMLLIVLSGIFYEKIIDYLSLDVAWKLTAIIASLCVIYTTVIRPLIPKKD